MKNFGIELSPSNPELENNDMVIETFYNLYHARLSSITLGSEELYTEHVVKVYEEDTVSIYKFIIVDTYGMRPKYALLHCVNKNSSKTKEVNWDRYSIKVVDED